MSKRNQRLGRFVKKNLGNIVNAITTAQASGATSGASKLDKAVDWINDKVDIPYLPEYLEEQIFKVAISTVVELAKAIWGDEDWFEKLQDVFGSD